jgi:hypothetical protein
MQVEEFMVDNQQLTQDTYWMEKGDSGQSKYMRKTRSWELSTRVPSAHSNGLSSSAS